MKPHTFAETLISPAFNEYVETMCGEAEAQNKLTLIPLSDNCATKN
jgi:hypothetical protein